MLYMLRVCEDVDVRVCQSGRKRSLVSAFVCCGACQRHIARRDRVTLKARPPRAAPQSRGSVSRCASGGFMRAYLVSACARHGVSRCVYHFFVKLCLCHASPLHQLILRFSHSVLSREMVLVRCTFSSFALPSLLTTFMCSCCQLIFLLHSSRLLSTLRCMSRLCCRLSPTALYM